MRDRRVLDGLRRGEHAGHRERRGRDRRNGASEEDATRPRRVTSGADRRSRCVVARCRDDCAQQIAGVGRQLGVALVKAKWVATREFVDDR